MTDDRIRDLYGRALARGVSLPENGSAGCVTPEDLLALVRGEGTEEHRLETLDHVMACETCHREFELLRAIDQAGTKGGATGRRASGWQRFAPLALAASLLLAVGIGLGVRRLGEPSDVSRGNESVVLLSPPAEVAARSPIIFVWRRVPNAHSYVLELLDRGPGGDGTIVFSRKTSDTSVMLKPVRLRPGAVYQWWVRALTPAGELASPMRPLRVRSQ
jgi:hypothetical protein